MRMHVALSHLLASVLVISGASAKTGALRCGDVTRDGLTNVADVVATLRAVVGVEPLTDLEDFEAADLAPTEELTTWNGARVRRYEGDGQLKVSDVVAALRIAVGLDLLNNCAPLPTISSALPAVGGTCTDGTATASVRGQRLIPDTGAPLVSVNGVPATVLRWESEAAEDAIWFTVPQLAIGSDLQYVDIGVVTSAGPVTAFTALAAREHCWMDYPYSVQVSPVDAERSMTVQATIAGNRVACLTSARLVGQVSGRVVDLTKLDPREDDSVFVEIPAQPGADGETFDLVVETPCRNVTLESAWRWYRPDTPDVTAVTPAFGPAEGGFEMRLSGTNLDTLTDIWVGQQHWTLPFGLVQVLSPQEVLILSVPASPVLTTTLSMMVLARNHGHGDPTPVSFTYVGTGTPRCDAFGPTSGPRSGGTRVTLWGAALSAVDHVEFGSSYVSITHVDPLTIEMTTRAVAAGGASDVRLVYDDGQVATCPTRFTFTP